MGVFGKYVGTRVLLHNRSLEIVREEIRGHRVWLIGRDEVGNEVLISLRALLKNAARGNVQLFALQRM